MNIFTRAAAGAVAARLWSLEIVVSSFWHFQLRILELKERLASDLAA